MKQSTVTRNDGTDEAAYLAKTHYCPGCAHKARLIIYRSNGRDAVKCGGCGRVDGFIKRESMTALWRRNPDAVPIHTRNVLERKYGVEAMTEQSLAKADEKQLAVRIEQARWLKELTPQDRTSLAHLCVKYGLDPLLKEMTLYEGAPYITVNGLIRIAHRQKEFAGIEDRPMTQEEQQQYHYKAPFAWIVKVYRTDWKCAAIGTGTGDPANPLRNNPIERMRPEWMARSRAIRQALKLAFPHSLPFEEIAAAEERGIDPETGEILEAAWPQMRVVESEPEAAMGEFADPSDLAPSGPSDVSEPQDEDAAKQDMREKIEAVMTARKLSQTQIEKWCQKNCQCEYAAMSLDGLLALKDALEAAQKAS